MTIAENTNGRVLETKEDRMITTRQAADATGYHQNHFNKLLGEGTIKGHKTENGRWQFAQSELDRYLASHAVKPKRHKKYMDKDADNKPAVSLLTQVDQKDKKIAELYEVIKQLKTESQVSNRVLEDTKAQHAKQLKDLQANVNETEKRFKQAEKRIAGLEEENNNLASENLDHVQFLRDTLADVLKYVMK